MQATTTTPTPDLELEIAAFHQPAVDSARRLIFWAGILYPLFPVLVFANLARLTGPSIFATSVFALLFGGGLVIMGLHFALAWWVKKSPLPATSLALAIFVGYQALLAHYGYFSNLIVTAIGLFVLGRGVLAGWRIHKLRSRQLV